MERYPEIMDLLRSRMADVAAAQAAAEIAILAFELDNAWHRLRSLGIEYANTDVERGMPPYDHDPAIEAVSRWHRAREDFERAVEQYDGRLREWAKGRMGP